METSGVFSSRAESLAKMMDAGGGDKELWTPGELGAVLEHQLSASVDFDLQAVSHGPAGRVQAVAAAAVPPIKTFRDLFTHSHPPVELLELAKRFAKQCRSHPESPLPDEVATVLYFLSIVAALMKCGRRISGLDNQALRHGLDWGLAQSWLDEDTRRLFCEGSLIVGDAKAAPP